MKKKYIYLVTVAALAMASCSEEEMVQQNGTNQLRMMEITAGLPDGDSRTEFKEGGVKWQEDDALSVFVGGKTNYQFTLTERNEALNEAVFTGEATVGEEYANNVAYYPYNEDVTLEGSNGIYTVTAQFPTKQTWAADGSFGPNSLPMVAVTETTETKDKFQFKTLGGWLQLYVKGDTKITKVVMKAKDKKIAGNYTVTASYGAAPTMTMAEDAVSYVALDCGEGVQLNSNEATLFTFAVAPFTFAAGEVSFDLYDDKGTFHKDAYTILKGGTVIANAYYTLSAGSPVEYVGVPLVATIGEIGYASLQEAIDDVQDGETITLAGNLEQEDGVIITDKNITLDLNEKTFKVTKGESTNNRNLLINGASVVTIKNGTMIAGGDINSGTYGTVRTEGTAHVTLEDLKLYNYRGNGLNIKALTGTTVSIINTEIYSQYGGGIEAAGATIEIDNVKVEQKGMWNAPYNSMTISVNGGGKAIVNSGTFSTECIAASDAYNQGTSHGPWVAGVLNSGGTLIINGGTFSNDNYGENSLATAARGAILADTGAKIEINGGVINALKSVIDIQNNLGDASKNPSVTISGGTFNTDPSVSNYYGCVAIAEGYTVVENNGVWTIEEALDAAALQEAINAAGEGEVISLNADVVLGEMLTVPADKKITIDLNGKKLSMEESIVTTTYAINNLGNLTLIDSSSNGTGSVTARGIYNGYDAAENYVTTAKLTVKSGTYNAMGTNGGAAIYNYGIVDIDGGKFKSNGGYGLNSQSGSEMTIDGANIKGGVYMSGSTVTIGEDTDVLQHLSGKHAVYVWAAELTVNGGKFDSESGNELIFADGQDAKVILNAGEYKKTAKSWLFAAATDKNITFTIKGGTYTGYVNQPEMTVDCIRPYGDPIEINGGTFNFDPTQWLVEGYKATKNEITGLWTIEELGYTVNENGDITVKSLVGLKNALTMAGEAGAGDTNIELSGDMNMTGVEWTPINVDGYHGADIVTLDGNRATITGLTAPLFAGGFAGGSGIVIKNLTIDQSTIVSSNGTGSGAFVESSDSQTKIVLENCHLTNSTVTGSRTGGLIGWTSGYSNVNDGPVKSYITIKNCSVIGCTITGSSVGGLNGHAGASDWTYTTIEDCKVQNCNLNSTDSGEWRVGVAVGTANSGEVTITNLTESGNTLTQTGKKAPTGEKRNYYGRFVPNSTGKLVIDGMQVVTTLSELQAALDAAEADVALSLHADITGNVKITQKEGIDIVIDGNNKTFTGVMTTFGNGRQSGSETLVIKNVNFVAAEGASSCIVSPDCSVNNLYSYSHNVTVENCAFTDPDGTVNCAAIRHEDGGDKNWNAKGCTVDKTMHSLFQVNNVEGKLTIDGCTVSSKNGANLNSCTNVEMIGCNFDVKGYAVRFGVNSGGNLGVAKNYQIKNSTLKSACDDGDAVVMFRASAVDATLTFENSTLEGTTKISGATEATTINGTY